MRFDAPNTFLERLRDFKEQSKSMNQTNETCPTPPRPDAPLSLSKKRLQERGAQLIGGDGLENCITIPGEAPENLSVRWGKSDNYYFAIGTTRSELAPALYECEYSDSVGPRLRMRSLAFDRILALPDTPTAEILEHIKRFDAMRDTFKSYGFLYKRGILLYGPPGTGKTTTLILVIKYVIEHMNGIALVVNNPEHGSRCLQMVRSIEPDRQIVVILEDFDRLCGQHSAAKFLALLDGEAQVDNVIFLATTNYVNLLDRAFVDRPSRFDQLIRIGELSASARRVYLQAVDSTLDGELLEDIVALTDGYTMAYLKEVVIMTRCFAQPLSSTIERLDLMRTQNPEPERKPEGEKATMGFAPKAETTKLKLLEQRRTREKTNVIELNDHHNRTNENFKDVAQNKSEISIDEIPTSLENEPFKSRNEVNVLKEDYVDEAGSDF